MRHLLIALFTLSSFGTSAASSYIEGNIQFNSTYLYESKTTAKMEAGHTFDTDTTVRFKIEDIPIGQTPHSRHHHHDNVYYGHSARAPLTTLGIEQKFQVSKNFWLGAGYEHLMQLGETMQYRPLFKIGYDFDEGVSLSHRTRVEAYAQHDRLGYKPGIDYRFDNKIAYQLKSHPIKLHYNNVIHMGGLTTHITIIAIMRWIMSLGSRSRNTRFSRILNTKARGTLERLTTHVVPQTRRLLSVVATFLTHCSRRLVKPWSRSI